MNDPNPPFPFTAGKAVPSHISNTAAGSEEQPVLDNDSSGTGNARFASPDGSERAKNAI